MGCAIIMVAVWNFQALGRGYGVLGLLSERSGAALASLGLAQSALAERDFTGSEIYFDDAQQSLVLARQELDDAIAAAEIVQSLLDVTGLVRSGDRVLAVGQAVTSAGQHVGRGLEHLATANIIETDPAAAGPPLVNVLRDALAEFGQAREQLATAETTSASISTVGLPRDIKEQVVALSATIVRVNELLGQFVDQGDMFLAVLGADREREYLLVFQNNDELRPTGGFIGSIGLVHVDQGVLEDVDVQTVYDGDGQLKEFIAPPEPLRAITDRWYLRDANWFVDYTVSARKIADFFEQEGGSTVDGVIALTPAVIQGMLEITGPISMPNYEVTVTAENFVAVTQAQVTYFYDKEVNRPKQFLADLTPILLNKLLGDSGQDPLKVLGVFTRMLQEKNMLIWLRDEQEAERIAELKWDGSLTKDQAGLLSVVNSNIGGHKSDQFMEQEIDYRTHVQADGATEVTTTIRRTHHGPTEALPIPYPDGENPAYKDNIIYQRVLIPSNAVLLEANGFSTAADVPHHTFTKLPFELQADPDIAEWQRVQSVHASGTAIGREAGYTSLANWVVTKPGATSIVFYRYRLAMPEQVPTLTDPAAAHTVYIVKQPGDDRTSVRVEMQLPGSGIIRHTVPDDGVTQTASNQLVYRGNITRDSIVGAVWTDI